MAATNPTSPAPTAPATPPTPAPAPDPIAALKQPAIMLSADFVTLQQKNPAAKFGSRRNVALNLGGSVDVTKSPTGIFFGVVKFSKLTPAVIAEVAALLAAAQAKSPVAAPAAA